MKSRLLPTLAAAMLGFAAAGADASTVYLSGFTFGSPTIATVQSTSAATPISPFAVYAGQYSGTLDGRAFVTYCVELTQYLSFGTTYDDYFVVSGVDAWGAAKSMQFDRLISALFSGSGITNASGSGLAQAAVWETLYETTGTRGFDTGSFQVASSEASISTAGAMDWSLFADVPIRYHVDLLHSVTAQDLMLITPAAIPEPSEVALMLAGALGLAMVSRRRPRATTGRLADAIR